MKKTFILVISATLVLFAMIACSYSPANHAKTDTVKIDSPSTITNAGKNIENGTEQITASVMVNIEGVITKVSDDGKRFLLNTGKWVVVTDKTEMGITGPNAAPKDQQFFEPTFRVGNSIAGFTEDENADELVAYAIYTNWNWDDPVR